MSVKSEIVGQIEKSSSMKGGAPRTTYVLVFMRTFPKLKSTLSTAQWPSVLFKGTLASRPTYLLWSMPPYSILPKPSGPVALKSKAKLCISETENGAGKA